MTVITRQFDLGWARVATPADTQIALLRIKGMTVIYDSSWSPYAQCSIDVQPPTGDELDFIEPRDGVRCRFRLTQIAPDGSTIYRDHDLGLRQRSQAWASGSVQLAAESDEALMRDYADDNDLDFNVNQNTDVLVGWAVDYALAGRSVDVRPDAPIASVQWDGDATWQPGVTAWDYAQQMAEAAGAWFYVDEAGTPHYAKPGWAADTSTFYLDDLTAIKDVSDVVSRDDDAWATGAIVKYTANDPNQIVASLGTREPRKVLVLERNARKPAGNAASKIRGTAQLRGRTLNVTALADIRARPNQTWRVQFAGQDRTGVIQSARFEFPAGLMYLQLNVNET